MGIKRVAGLTRNRILMRVINDAGKVRFAHVHISHIHIYRSLKNKHIVPYVNVVVCLLSHAGMEMWACANSANL
jgi:hypothetical protein